MLFARGLSRGLSRASSALGNAKVASRALGNAALSDLGDVYGASSASPQALATFRAWHGAIDAGMAGGDARGVLRPILHDRCVFRPPTYFAPWTGGDEVCVLLEAAGEVFGSSFAYGRQWLSEDGREWALEFRADVAATGKALDGIDLVSVDADGLITDFAVLARPPNAVAALKDEMMRRVPVKMATLKAKQALGFA